MRTRDTSGTIHTRDNDAQHHNIVYNHHNTQHHSIGHMGTVVNEESNQHNRNHRAHVRRPGRCLHQPGGVPRGDALPSPLL